MKNRKRAATPEAIAKRNAAFAKLSPAQQRVQVAEDVIAALNANQLKARAGSYLSVHGKFELLENYDAQKALLEGKVSCSVCAIGSVFVCAVERKNGIALNDMPHGKEGMTRYLKGIFSDEQLDLMECAFECTIEHVREDDGGDLIVDKAQAELAVEFGRQFEEYDEDGDLANDSDACMRAIMNNVIANNGTFKP